MTNRDDKKSVVSRNGAVWTLPSCAADGQGHDHTHNVGFGGPWAQVISSPRMWQYKQVASAYATRFDATAARLFGYPFVFQALATSRTPEVVVDFGCGPGAVAALAAEQWNCLVHAVDPSVAMLDIARRQYCDPRVSYRHISPGSLTFLSDGTVDAVMCTLVMATTPDVGMLECIVREAHRVLRPGGHFAVLEGNPAGVGVKFTMKRPAAGPLPKRPGDAWPVLLKTVAGPYLEVVDYYWDLPTYLRLFEAAGFRDVYSSAPTLEMAKQVADPEDLAAASWDTERIHPPYVLIYGRR